MADGLGGLLTQKIGPAPGWVWALGIGGIAFLFGPKLLKGGATTAAHQPGAFDPQSFEAGFAQGRGYQPQPQPVPQPVPGTLPPQGAPPGVSQSPPNPYRRLDGYPAAVGGAAATAPRNRSASVSSRLQDPHAYWHPSIKQVPKFPHFVRGGVGGAAGAGGAHATAVHQLAHQAELHPARLQMLNPKPHRFVRVA